METETRHSDKNTVRAEIFRSNVLMVFTALAAFLVIAIAVVKGYTEIQEQEFRDSFDHMRNHREMEDILSQWLSRRNYFLMAFVIGGLVCIILLVLVSQLFSKRLTQRIMEPLIELKDGANRIRRNDLRQDIIYGGLREFEDVTDTFNEMQRHIFEEREKNRKNEQARKDMIAGISHDLRTPLTAIRGAIKGMIDGVADTPEMRTRFLQAAFRRTGEMNSLLQQMINLSRIEAGNVQLAMEETEAFSFLSEYVGARQEDLDPEQEELRLEAADSPAKIEIDPDQMLRIFDNLVENSRKYAKASPLRMRIRTMEDAETLTIGFSDNGGGVADEKLPHIFEEFYRGDESRHEQVGNGLGLYIVRYLINAMGGTVWAENGGGFTVWMRFKKAEKAYCGPEMRSRIREGMTRCGTDGPERIKEDGYR